MSDHDQTVPPQVVPTSRREAVKAGYYITDFIDKQSSEDFAHELNDEAIWSVSSAKPGNGVQELLSEDLDTFWQSDSGQAPHIVTAHFLKRQSISEVAVFLDSTIDESYTPSSITIKSGSSPHDLEDVRQIYFEYAVGWLRIPLGNFNGMGIARYHRTWHLQIVINQMLNTGRDCHVRCVKLLGPQRSYIQKQRSRVDGPEVPYIVPSYLEPNLSTISPQLFRYSPMSYPMPLESPSSSTSPSPHSYPRQSPAARYQSSQAPNFTVPDNRYRSEMAHGGDGDAPAVLALEESPFETSLSAAFGAGFTWR